LPFLWRKDGGIILTASHNPKQWNALKLLNEKEFLNGIEGEKILLSLKPKRLISQMWTV
jgi:phosphomannomutase